MVIDAEEYPFEGNHLREMGSLTVKDGFLVEAAMSTGHGFPRQSFSS